MPSVVSVIVIAAVTSCLLTPVARSIGRRMSVVDVPNHRSSHDVPTPRTGGYAIFIGIVVAIGINIVMAGSPRPFQLGPLIACTFAIALLAAFDELTSLPVAVRFLTQLLIVSLAVAYAGAGFVLGTLGLLAAPLAVLWIAWVVNAYNFMDGINGIASCEAIVCGATYIVLFARNGDVGGSVVAAAVVGAAAGFLPWNFPRASIFMGDVGSTALGFLLAVETVRLANAGHAIAALLPLLPFLLDTTVTLVRRIARRERFWQAHRSHFYQRLVQTGRSHQFVTMIWALLAVGGGLLAVMFDALSPIGRIAGLTIVGVAHVSVALIIERTYQRGLR